MYELSKAVEWKYVRVIERSRILIIYDLHTKIDFIVLIFKKSIKIIIELLKNVQFI